jgi:hypothetical protein
MVRVNVYASMMVSIHTFGTLHCLAEVCQKRERVAHRAKRAILRESWLKMMIVSYLVNIQMTNVDPRPSTRHQVDEI